MCGSTVDIQSATAENRPGKERRRKKIELEMLANAQPDGRPAEYRWRVCKSSVIPFLVPRRKLWLTPTARVPCSNAVIIDERKTWTQSEFCSWQTRHRARAPESVCVCYTTGWSGISEC